MGIEFNASGKRVAYHFWEHHPYDDVLANMAFESQERVRVPAEMVIHIKERRIAGQLRGSPKITRAMTKIFQLESYDDAELERKKTAALFAVFITGKESHEAELEDNREKTKIEQKVEKKIEEVPEEHPIYPGSVNVVDGEKQITFSTPVEVGGSYEAFQFRNILKICAALNMP
ncbi:phage portal protein, partial [Bartonella sp. MR100HLJHH]|uniref:phage portal protein n=1 Tax=Bartonella sp. MR100HLJHH TaxID=3243554 RepID=UPI0035D08F1D